VANQKEDVVIVVKRRRSLEEVEENLKENLKEELKENLKEELKEAKRKEDLEEEIIKLFYPIYIKMYVYVFTVFVSLFLIVFAINTTDQKVGMGFVSICGVVALAILFPVVLDKKISGTIKVSLKDIIKY